jgi:antitoxin FitA
MPAIIVRNISAETHWALRLRAKEHGRSTEGEIRAILDEAVQTATRVRLGSALAALAKPFGGHVLDIRTGQIVNLYFIFWSNPSAVCQSIHDRLLTRLIADAVSPRDRVARLTAVCLLSMLPLETACHRAQSPSRGQLAPSSVVVSVSRDGPVLIKTSAAEFDVLPSGYVQAYFDARWEADHSRRSRHWHTS